MTGRARRQRNRRRRDWRADLSYHGDVRGWLCFRRGRVTREIRNPRWRHEP